MGNAPSNFLTAGEEIDLVRWLLGRDGWYAETIHGRYVRSDGNLVHVMTAGRLLTVDRDEWAVAIP